MNKIYLIGNSHIDPVWLWRWQDGYSEVLATFRSACDRMKEYDDFCYTSACAVYYQWVEKTDPALFSEIVKYVKEGRWNITGGWFLQPDCNLPCGESFARQTLISQRYFKEKFGITARCGYNVDSFGHNASLPKILRAGGMDRYVYMRPSDSEKELAPDLFRWQSDDGSEVTAFHIQGSYNINTDKLERFDLIEEKMEADGVDRMAFYGVGNHGGGPTVELIEAIKARRLPNAVFSTVDRYFDEVDTSNLPVVKDELQHHARGCYSVMSYVKTMNRACEENLLAAERYCVLAHRLTGYEYPKKALRKAWKNLLFNQFHDILGGCSIESAYTDASYLFGEIMSITEQAINGALQAISRKIGTGNAKGATKSPKRRLVWENDAIGMPIIVYNPHAFPVRETVVANITAARMTDEKGNAVPMQYIRGEKTNGQTDKYAVSFPVEIPALGYRVYRAFQSGETEIEFPSVCATEHSLENEFLRAEFDPGSGEIVRVTDKRSGKTVAEGGMRAILTDETPYDTWAHNAFDLGPVCGEFGDPTFKVLEAGSVSATLRVTVRYGGSRLTRDYTLTANSDALLVRGEVDFHEHHKALKLTFPAKDSVRCEIPYGTLERPLLNGEEPFGKWFASDGLCVLNTGKYGYDSTEREIRMTVLRGAIYADHFGERDDRCAFMDQGIHRFSYALCAFRGNADANRRAAQLHTPVRTVCDTFHDGDLPLIYGGISVDADNVTVTALKMAEDGDVSVLRLLECEGADTDCLVTLFGKPIEATLSHNAIRTVDENGKPLDFMEWEV